VDLAFLHREVDMIVGHDAWKALRDTDQLDCSCHVPSKTQKRDRTVVRPRSCVLLQIRPCDQAFVGSVGTTILPLMMSAL